METWNGERMEEKECSEIRVSGIEKERRAAVLRRCGSKDKGSRFEVGGNH
jgi:hypothetical protein